MLFNYYCCRYYPYSYYFEPLLDMFKGSLRALPKELHPVHALVRMHLPAGASKDFLESKKLSSALAQRIPTHSWNLKSKELRTCSGVMTGVAALGREGVKQGKLLWACVRN